MRIVLVGPPGSGKGTQADLLVERQNLTYIGTGDLLRDAVRRGTDVGKRVEPLLKAGKLVPDDVVNQLIADLFRAENHPIRFVLDGYPRTVSQAIWFDKLLHDLKLDLHAVIQLMVSDEEVVRRMTSRRVCPDCKRTYNLLDRPPKRAGFCDYHEVPLIQRPDDNEETIRERLRVFHGSADDLVAHYRKAGLLKEIPTNASIEAIQASILQVVNVTE